MPPFLAGGEMIREVHLRRSEFNDIPWKFEAGTPDISAAVGLGAAADYLRDLGMANVREHERELVEYALEVLPRAVPSIELYGPPADVRGGVVPFNLPGVHPHDVAQVLDRYGIAIRAGHHCTMPLHERLDLAATARASFGVYTTKARHRRAGRRAPAGRQAVRGRGLRSPPGRIRRSVPLAGRVTGHATPHFARLPGEPARRRRSARRSARPPAGVANHAPGHSLGDRASRRTGPSTHASRTRR